MTLSIAPPNSSAADVEELTSRVAELERTQRSEDVEGFLALFDDEAVWVSAGGVRLIGRDTIAEFTRKVLPGAFADGTVRYDVEHIRFVTPDIALTGVNQEYLSVDGQRLVPRQEGRPSYLWQRKNRQWFIVCGQNTSVPVNLHSY
jgi:uncharacterized protein (TIGR02246 family)